MQNFEQVLTLNSFNRLLNTSCFEDTREMSIKGRKGKDRDTNTLKMSATRRMSVLGTQSLLDMVITPFGAAGG